MTAAHPPIRLPVQAVRFFLLLPQAFLFLFCSLLFLLLLLFFFLLFFNQRSVWIACTAHDALGTIGLVCSEFLVCSVAGYVRLAQRSVRCVSVGRVGTCDIVEQWRFVIRG